ncbi:glycosyltransferase family 2 protein [Laspinema olomoucense]|uniref:Glycosyltransferase family 2 protein n=1 Tax=Laspinema olomoucense D3b TaxID=2953688 RepID=A0ABT2N3M1_9CYAN|nr:glycosyltransferase family 2 protein [Laspinema sp. D3b]MCT7977177.1 glycosyltransferase family 2 protein [Laspinema sp. D3b]
MDDWQLTTPVALLIFNRPDTTAQVFESIRQAQPSQLLVIADGPRSDRPGEAEKCAATRQIIDRVDWDCQVLKHYSDINLGCKWRVSSGIDWVFDTVEEAIILEDDCLPNQSFFRYCQELLTQYRDDPRVMHIAGSNEGITGQNLHESYYFSRRTHIWGWATWRRAWQAYYDVDMKLWPELKQTQKLAELIGNKRESSVKTQIFDLVYENQIDTWDHQWNFACIYHQNSSILPNRNLVSNIGFGHQEATHTIHPSSFGDLPRHELDFPMIHPQIFKQDVEADDQYFEARQTNQVKRLLNADELAEWV